MWVGVKTLTHVVINRDEVSKTGDIADNHADNALDLHPQRSGADTIIN